MGVDALEAPLPADSAPAAPAERATSASERWANIAFALSALLAAVMRLASTPLEQWWLPAIVGISAINGLIGVLFLLRRPVLVLGTPSQLASCLPTMLGFALAVRLAPPLENWLWHAHALFAAAALLTLAAFLRLGTSFGVLPALRQTVDRGPYALVRHPAYAGELLMALACFSAGPSLLAASAWLLLLPGVLWRIAAEETVLGSAADYQAYAHRVCWRLVPGLW
jgi:protein-S-isoprenylcysteine O-methyltransferase Ste14